ncbi:MAG: 2TM domain-containing protein [Ignavibacteria bacterium]|nr:2TM domain-containing protein [Ignavibacteria bacterium]
MDTQNNFNSSSQPRDERLWRLAKKRAEFKKHLLTYLVINIFFWAFWAFNSFRHNDFDFPWPVFVTFGWGIGLGINYISAYSSSFESLREKEYNKLINKN